MRSPERGIPVGSGWVSRRDESWGEALDRSFGIRFENPIPQLEPKWPQVSYTVVIRSSVCDWRAPLYSSRGDPLNLKSSSLGFT